MAAPPSAAAMIGPAPSPHEKALWLLLELRFPLELERLDWRLWVRVAIGILLGVNLADSTVRGGGAFLSGNALRPPFAARIQPLFDGSSGGGVAWFAGAGSGAGRVGSVTGG